MKENIKQLNCNKFRKKWENRREKVMNALSYEKTALRNLLGFMIVKDLLMGIAIDFRPSSLPQISDHPPCFLWNSSQLNMNWTKYAKWWLGNTEKNKVTAKVLGRVSIKLTWRNCLKFNSVCTKILNSYIIKKIMFSVTATSLPSSRGEMVAAL